MAIVEESYGRGREEIDNEEQEASRCDMPGETPSSDVIWKEGSGKEGGIPHGSPHISGRSDHMGEKGDPEGEEETEEMNVSRPILSCATLERPWVGNNARRRLRNC